MRTGSYQHASAHAFKFRDVSHEQPVHKDRSSRRVDLELYGRLHCGHHSRRRFRHHHANDLFLSRLYVYAFGEVLVAILTDCDRMFAGQKKNSLRSLEFLEIADVASVDPDTEVFSTFDFPSN